MHNGITGVVRLAFAMATIEKPFIFAIFTSHCSLIIQTYLRLFDLQLGSGAETGLRKV